jgi:hypothetical protein
MVDLKIALWLESHQPHSVWSEVFDFFHLSLIESNFFATQGVECANLIPVQSMASLFTYELGRRLQRLIVLFVDLLGSWFLSWHNGSEEAQANLGPA